MPLRQWHPRSLQKCSRRPIRTLSTIPSIFNTLRTFNMSKNCYCKHLTYLTVKLCIRVKYLVILEVIFHFISVLFMLAHLLLIFWIVLARMIGYQREQYPILLMHLLMYKVNFKTCLSSIQMFFHLNCPKFFHLTVV